MSIGMWLISTYPILMSIGIWLISTYLITNVNRNMSEATPIFLW